MCNSFNIALQFHEQVIKMEAINKPNRLYYLQNVLHNTPGPWLITSANTQKSKFYLAGNRQKTQLGTAQTIIAEVEPMAATWAADSAIIQAAPEMLAALQYARQTLIENGLNSKAEHMAVDRLTAAIILAKQPIK